MPLENGVTLNEEKSPALARRYLPLVIKLSVTLGILTLLFYQIDPFEMGRILLSARYDYLLIALVIQFCLVIIPATKLYLLLRVHDLLHPVHVIFFLNLIAAFYSLFLPGTLMGGVVKWYRLSQTAGSKAQVMSAMVMDQLSHHAMILILGLLAFSLMLSPDIITLDIVYAISLLLGGIFLFLSAVLCKRLSGIVEKVGNFTLLWNPPRLLVTTVESTWSAFKMYQDHKLVLIKVYGLAFIFQVFTFFVGYVVSKSITLNIDFFQLVWILALVMIVRNLPISISGLGVREGAFVFLFGLVGISMEQALSYSLLGFALTVVVALVGGIIEGWSAFRTKKFYGTIDPEDQK